MLVSAARALDAQEPCFEPATTKIVVELPAHESRQARPLLAQVVEEGAGVLLEHLVEHGVLRSVADVAALASGPRARALLPVASCVGVHARHCSPSPGGEAGRGRESVSALPVWSKYSNLLSQHSLRLARCSTQSFARCPIKLRIPIPIG